jgi:hypothetical protein
VVRACSVEKWFQPITCLYRQTVQAGAGQSAGPLSRGVAERSLFHRRTKRIITGVIDAVSCREGQRLKQEYELALRVRGQYSLPVQNQPLGEVSAQDASRHREEALSKRNAAASRVYRTDPISTRTALTGVVNKPDVHNSPFMQPQKCFLPGLAIRLNSEHMNGTFHCGI